MKKITLLLSLIFLINCSSTRDEEVKEQNNKYYLYKIIEITDGTEKVHNYESGQCESNTNIFFDTNNKVTWQGFNMTSGNNCTSSTAYYTYDSNKKKIQIFSYMYYSVKDLDNQIVLQTHMEENDDPNYTTIYYFKKK